MPREAEKRERREVKRPLTDLGRGSEQHSSSFLEEGNIKNKRYGHATTTERLR